MIFFAFASINRIESYYILLFSLPQCGPICAWNRRGKRGQSPLSFFCLSTEGDSGRWLRPLFLLPHLLSQFSANASRKEYFRGKTGIPPYCSDQQRDYIFRSCNFYGGKKVAWSFLGCLPHYFSRGSGNFLACVWEEGGNLNTSPEGNSQISTPGKKLASPPLSSSTYHPLSFFPFLHSKQAGGGEGNADNQGWVGGWGTLLHRTLTKESRLSNSPTYFSNTM